MGPGPENQAVTIAAATASFILASAMCGWMVLQWTRRGRKPHHAAWTLGFLLYAIGTFIEAFLPWTPATLRVYYLVAAFLVAATLGQGTAYLLLRPRAAHVLAALLGLGALAAAAACALVPLDPSIPLPERGTLDFRMLPPWLRRATMPFNLYGLALLAGGAALSIARYRKAPGGGRRALANVCNLVGVLTIGAAGGATKAGHASALFYAELLGLVLLAAGVFLAG
jgi:hypothetical protein